jgi:hypothetical protein
MMDRYEVSRRLKRMYKDDEMHTEDINDNQHDCPDDEYIALWCEWEQEMSNYDE